MFSMTKSILSSSNVKHSFRGIFSLSSSRSKALTRRRCLSSTFTFTWSSSSSESSLTLVSFSEYTTFWFVHYTFFLPWLTSDGSQILQTKKRLCFEDFFLFFREHLRFQFNAINGIIASGRFRSRTSLKDHRKGSWDLGQRIILFPIPDFVEEKCFRPSHDGRRD